MPDFENVMGAELDQPPTKRDIGALRDAMHLHFGDALTTTRDELRWDFTGALDSTRDELRRHFDVVAEKFHDDFSRLFDWTQSTTSTMGRRIDGFESRLTRLERRSKR